MRPVVILLLGITIAHCGSPLPMPDPPIPERCEDEPFTLSEPTVLGPTIHFGLQGGSHLFADVVVRGLDEGGRLALVAADPETSEVFGSWSLGVIDLEVVDDDPCIRRASTTREFRFDRNLAPYTDIVFRAVATRSDGTTTSGETSACLVPAGGDPAICDAPPLTLMLLYQDGEMLRPDSVLWMDDPDDSGRWTALFDVEVDPVSEGSVQVESGGGSTAEPLVDGRAASRALIRSGTHPAVLLITSRDSSDQTLARAEYRVLPVPECAGEAEHPCLSYWDTIFVDVNGVQIDPELPTMADAVAGAELWVDSRGFVSFEAQLELRCDDEVPLLAEVSLTTTPLNFEGVPLALPLNPGPHECAVRVSETSARGVRVVADRNITYHVAP